MFAPAPGSGSCFCAYLMLGAQGASTLGGSVQGATQLMNPTNVPPHEASGDDLDPGSTQPIPWCSSTKCPSQRMTRGSPTKRKYEPDSLQAAKDMDNCREFCSSRRSISSSSTTAGLESWNSVRRRFRSLNLEQIMLEARDQRLTETQVPDSSDRTLQIDSPETARKLACTQG